MRWVTTIPFESTCNANLVPARQEAVKTVAAPGGGPALTNGGGNKWVVHSRGAAGGNKSFWCKGGRAGAPRPTPGLRNGGGPPAVGCGNGVAAPAATGS